MSLPEVDQNKKILLVESKKWNHYAYEEDVEIGLMTVKYKKIDGKTYITPACDTYISEVDWTELVKHEEYKKKNAEEKAALDAKKYREYTIVMAEYRKKSFFYRWMNKPPDNPSYKDFY